MEAGLKIGSMCVITVLFGLYAVKNVNVPMFTCFRRCAILPILIMNYLIRSQHPSTVEVIGTTFICVGAVVAGWEDLDSAWFGYVLVWGNNTCQAI